MTYQNHQTLSVDSLDIDLIDYIVRSILSESLDNSQLESEEIEFVKSVVYEKTDLHIMTMKYFKSEFPLSGLLRVNGRPTFILSNAHNPMFAIRYTRSILENDLNTMSFSDYKTQRLQYPQAVTFLFCCFYVLRKIVEHVSEDERLSLNLKLKITPVLELALIKNINMRY